MSRIYVVGSLHRPAEVQWVASALRDSGHEVFDNWIAAGPEADFYWQDYETLRGHDYLTALNDPVAQHSFDFDMKWLVWCDTAVLVMPAGKSGHLEIGWLKGQGKRCYVVFPEPPEKWDLMYKLLDGVFFSVEDLVKTIK